MKSNKLFHIILVLILTAAPFLYAAFIWNKLPDRVPTHFGLDGQPNDFGDKKHFLIPIVLLMTVGLGVYFLIKNLHKIDPKRVNTLSRETFDKFAVLLLSFMSLLSIYIVYSTVQSKTGGFLFVLIGLFLAAMGNLMHSIKPNYFVGIRVPWTLNDDDNWRRTHQLASKMWVVGGLAIAVLGMLLPEKIAFFSLIVIIFLVCCSPILYSYRLFKKTPV